MAFQFHCIKNKKKELISKVLNVKAHPGFTFKRKVIKRLDTLRPLGVYFLPNFKWADHHSKGRYSCSRRLGIILLCKRFLPDESILSLFKSCVGPLMEYAFLSFCRCTEKPYRLSKHAAVSETLMPNPVISKIVPIW